MLTRYVVINLTVYVFGVLNVKSVINTENTATAVKSADVRNVNAMNKIELR
jgi:hypothetical protein